MKGSAIKTGFALGGIALAFFMGLQSCQSPGGPVELTLFHTNDLHSHLRAAKVDPFGLGGLARMKTLLDSLRKNAPNSLTLDAGDWSEGAWYYSVDVGANMLGFLDALGFDATCLGNHDFLSGPDQISKTVLGAKKSFPVLAANLDMSAYAGRDKLNQALPGYVIKEVGGLKVGLIGLTTYEFVYNTYLAPVKILDPLDAATQVALKLRPLVDVLLLISHNSFDVNSKLAQWVPGIDAVISGHSHRKTPQPYMAPNSGRSVPVVETGAWGKFLGELKLSVDPVAHRVAFAGYQLHPVTPDLEEDPKIAAMVDAQDRLLNAQFHEDVSQVVAESDFDLWQRDSQESALGNLAVRAYREVSGADLSLEEISLTGVSIAKGPVTLMDLHDVVPHIYNPATKKEWGLKVWNARGSDLALVFDAFYTVAGLMPLSTPLGWLSADNAAVVWDPSRTVESIRIGDQPLDPTARYKTALSDGLLFAISTANSQLNLGIDLTQIVDTGLEAWQSVVQYATSKQKLTLADLQIGGHARTTGPDVALYDYDIQWDGKALDVQIQNQGLKAAAPGTVVCSAGVPNDFVVYDSDAQQWQQIGIGRHPQLEPGMAAHVPIPWDTTGLASGYWPVQCQVTSAGDVYTANNSAVRVFRSEGSSNRVR